MRSPLPCPLPMASLAGLCEIDQHHAQGAATLAGLREADGCHASGSAASPVLCDLTQRQGQEMQGRQEGAHRVGTDGEARRAEQQRLRRQEVRGGGGGAPLPDPCVSLNWDAACIYSQESAGMELQAGGGAGESVDMKCSPAPHTCVPVGDHVGRRRGGEDGGVEVIEID